MHVNIMYVIHTVNFQFGLDLVSQKEKSSKGLKCTLYVYGGRG